MNHKTIDMHKSFINIVYKINMNFQNTVFGNKIASQKYPLLITLSFFIIISCIAFSQNNFLKDGDFILFTLKGEQILFGDREGVKLMTAPAIGPVIYAIVNLLVDDIFITGKIVALLSGTGIVFFSYYIIRNIFGHKIAIVGQLLVAFTPKIDVLSLQTVNELPAIFFIFASLYFGTKKDLKFSDIIIVGSLIGVACLFRYQAIMVLFGFMIFMLIRSKKIRINLFHVVVLGIFFLIAFSPLLIYNYTTHEVLIDTSGNYELINKTKYQTPDWVEKLKIEAMRESPTNFFVDLDLFFKNYFYNVFYHNPDKLFHFNSISNISIVPTVPFLGFIIFTVGLIYLSKIKLDKITIITLISSSSITAILVSLLGDIETHFFAIIIIPLLIITMRNIKKIERNFLPLLIISIVFMFFMSTYPLSSPRHLLAMWIIFPTLGAVFFVEIIPKIYSKIRNSKMNDIQPKSHNKTIIAIVLIVLLVNLAHSYKSVENYLYEQEPYSGIMNEVTKTFERNEPLVEKGMEIKQISEVLGKQPGIENSYLMASNIAWLYYVDTNLIITNFQDGVKNDPIEKFLARENWSDWDIWYNSINNYPADRHNKNRDMPDYLIYSPQVILPWKYDIDQTQYEDLKILADPSNPKIPSNFELLYKSDKSGIVLYKINKVN